MFSKKTFIAALVLFFISLPLAASAVPTTQLSEIAKQVGLPQYKSFGALILDVIQVALVLVFIVAVVFLIVSGYRMITAMGNEEALTKAKTGLTWAIAGSVLVVLAWVIVRAIASLLEKGSGGV